MQALFGENIQLQGTPGTPSTPSGTAGTASGTPSTPSSTSGPHQAHTRHTPGPIFGPMDPCKVRDLVCISCSCTCTTYQYQAPVPVPRTYQYQVGVRGYVPLWDIPAHVGGCVGVAGGVPPPPPSPKNKIHPECAHMYNPRSTARETFTDDSTYTAYAALVHRCFS